MTKALFILRPETRDLIFGEEERAAVSEMVEVIGPPLSAEEAVARPDLLREVEVILSGWGAPLMDETFLAAAPNLRAVFYGSGSVRDFVTEAFWGRGIVLSNAYAANAVPVSEYVTGAILLSLKHVWRHMLARRGLCEAPPRDQSPGAFRSTVGLISHGMIARMVRERLLAHDLEILVHDPYLTPEEAEEHRVRPVGLEELFASADVVSLHTPLLDETRGLLRKTHFERMKPWSTFINTARGAVVNEAEMIDVLRARPDIQAVLDVTWPEPPEPDSPLYQLENVVMTPHIAGSVNRECRRMGQYMVDELRRHLRGEPLLWQLTRQRAAVLA